MPTLSEAIELVMEEGRSRSEKISKIQQLAPHLAKHLILLHHAPDTVTTRPHWATEINASLKKMSEFSVSGGKPLKHYDWADSLRGHLSSEQSYRALHRKAQSDESKNGNMKLSRPTEDDHEIILDRLDRVIEKLSKGDAPTYEDIK